MKTALYSLLACLLLFPVAFADTLNNGDFETGLLSPWASIGTAGITGVMQWIESW